MESFRKLGLSHEFLKSVEKAGLKEPSEIQEKAIPLVLQGKDVIGGSHTGSGKTLAFGAGIIERTESGKGLQVLILTPTRELAEQVGSVLRKFSEYKRLKTAIVYGGVGISQQMTDLKKSEIVVGTPGRILDHLQRGTINLSGLKTLVLDEADRMLDMGFIKDVETIIKNCPKERQTLLFSATISHDLQHITSRHMKNPESVSVESYVSTEKLKQIFYDVPRELKFSLLVHLLKKERSGLVMVFCNTRHNTDFVAENLKTRGIQSLTIHGGLTQDRRNRIMKMFHGKDVYVLVCTDIAARGLDIKEVSHVYNYDIPKTSKDYIHRIGRTARAGKEGIAINIVSEMDYENFNEVLKDDSLQIEKTDLPKLERMRINIINRRPSNSRNWGPHGRGYRRDRERGRGIASHRKYGSHSQRDSQGKHDGFQYGERREYSRRPIQRRRY